MSSINALVNVYAEKYASALVEKVPAGQFEAADTMVRTLMEYPEKELYSKFPVSGSSEYNGVCVYLNGPYVHVLFRPVDKRGNMCYVYKEYETVNDLENEYIITRGLARGDDHYYTNRKQLFARLGNLSSS